jgi:hypothetical protein
MAALPPSPPLQTRPVEPDRVNAPVSRCSGLPRPRRARAQPAWGGGLLRVARRAPRCRADPRTWQPDIGVLYCDESQFTPTTPRA